MQLHAGGILHAVDEIGDRRHKYIKNAAAPGAPHMIMRLDVEIKVIGAGRHRHAQNLALRGQLVQIAVNRGLADGRVLRRDNGINRIRGRVVVHLIHCLQYDLTLNGVSGLHKMHLLY